MSKINFQPMPKRFMVWDKNKKRFCTNLNNYKNIFSLIELSQFIIHHQDYKFLQSTNLFDKDGKEIFEGDIVENEMGWTGRVEIFKGQLVVNYRDAKGQCVHLLYDICKVVKVVGHMVLDPERLEKDR